MDQDKEKPEKTDTSSPGSNTHPKKILISDIDLEGSVKHEVQEQAAEMPGLPIPPLPDTSGPSQEEMMQRQQEVEEEQKKQEELDRIAREKQEALQKLADLEREEAIQMGVIPEEPQPGPKPDIPLPKRKPKATKTTWIIWMVTAILICAIVGSTAYLILDRKEENVTIVMNQPTDYMVLSSVSIMNSPTSSVSSGKLLPGQTTCIYQVTDGGSHESWGMISDNQWVKIKDAQYTYLIQTDQISYSSYPENRHYTAQEEVNVYTLPMSISEPVDILAAGKKVYILETTWDSSNVQWGKIAEDQWVALSDNDNVWLSIIPEVSTADLYSNDLADEYVFSADDPSNVQKADGDDEDKEDHDDAEEAEAGEDETEESDAASAEVNGYSAGNYVLNYRMKVRSSAGYDADTLKTIESGEQVYIAGLKAVDENNSVWGVIDSEDSGMWICIQDDDLTYLTRQE